jgi:hypothetical protein
MSPFLRAGAEAKECPDTEGVVGEEEGRVEMAEGSEREHHPMTEGSDPFLQYAARERPAESGPGGIVSRCPCILAFFTIDQTQGVRFERRNG